MPRRPETTSKAAFDQWYRYTPSINLPFIVYLRFAPNGNLFTFQSNHFFPLDNAGFGNSGKGNDKKMHNFSFTTELHATFQYNGGESFKFTGDDDVWVFVNGKLAVDLGGLHSAKSSTIDLDSRASELGITKGGLVHARALPRRTSHRPVDLPGGHEPRVHELRDHPARRPALTLAPARARS